MTELAQQHAAHIARRQRLGYPPMRKRAARTVAPVAVTNIESAPPERDRLDVATPQWTWRDSAALHMRSAVSNITAIQIAVCWHYRIRMYDLLSMRRTKDVTWPRQIAMYLAKHLTVYTLPQIGRRFGGKDHTTILHAVRKVEALRSADPKLGTELDELEAVIRNSPAFTGMVP